MDTSSGLLFGAICINSSKKNFNDFVMYAKTMFPNADALINCHVDGNFANYICIYMKNGYTYRATAVRYIQPSNEV